MNQESNVSHVTGFGATTNSDYRLSRTISVETPHDTSVDRPEVVSTLPPPEDCASSDRHLLFDTEAANPRTESTNFSQLAQPLYVFLAYPLLNVDLCGLG